MISILQPQECIRLLTTTTVGRIGFVMDERVHIFPVNYVFSGRDLLVRTSAEGILHRVAAESAQVAFEIDHHDDLGGTGWSVLMHGPLTAFGSAEVPAVIGRVSPWASEDRDVPLRFTIESISGRHVRRDQRRGREGW